MRDTLPLNWNADCTKVMMQWKNEDLIIIDFSTNTTVITQPLTDMTDPFGLDDYVFIDAYDKFIGVSTTYGLFMVYDIYSLNAKVT